MLVSSGTVATAIDSPASHDWRFQRVRRAIPVEAFPGANQHGHSASEDHSEVSVEGHVDATEPLRTAALWAAFATLDSIILPDLLKKRPCVMRSVPHFLKGPFRNALRLALAEAVSEEVICQERGWKLMLLLPHMLLHRPPRGGLIAKDKLHQRFQSFVRGEWLMLLEASGRCYEEAAIARRRRRHQGDDVQKRAGRADLKVALGELSSSRQALEGGEIAPGTRATLQQLTDESKHPPRLIVPVPPEIMSHTLRVPFALDSDKFLKNVRSAKRGAAAGSSGVTVEHLRPLLDSVTDQQWLCKLAEQFAQGRITPTVIEAIRMGKMTALRQANGGVRGIVVGDVVRRLVVRTMAQQLAPEVESATAPFQYALSTRAGSECHVIQGLSELNPDSTLMSIDGISAYDQTSRAAMLDGLYVERPSRSSACSTGHHQLTSGKTQKEWNIPFCKAKVVSRGVPRGNSRGACRRGEFGRVPRRHLGCVASPRAGQSRVRVSAAQFVFPRTDSSPWRQDTGLEPERNQT